VSTTSTYYIKTDADDVRKAMTRLEDHLTEGAYVQSGADDLLKQPAPAGHFSIQ
jgi:hypothetical protein